MNYTQAQIDRANAVSLEDFLRTQGETLIKSGREYRWKEHDSLTVRGNKWFRHSQSKGGYRKAGYSRKFREEHEEEILLHQAAKNAFDEMDVKKLPKVKELQTEYAKLLEEKKKTYAEYRRSREEMRELLTAKAMRVLGEVDGAA